MTILVLVLWWSAKILLALTVVILVSLYIRGAFRSSVHYRVKNAPSVGDSRFPIVLASLSNSFLTQGSVTHFWSTPDQIQAARLDAIQSAKKSIHFETFFMTPGKRANDFAAAISERANAGLEVLLVVDSYGVLSLPNRYWERLRAAGVQLVFFNPFDWRAPANFAGRTHRKLLLIDGTVGLMGGAGISDDWDGDEQRSPWLDIEVQLEGELISFLEGQFIQHWTYGGGTANLRRESFHSNPLDSNSQMLITAGNNPTYRFSPIKALKENTIVAAKKRIWLASPYLLPDPNSCDLLIEAKKAGVDVRLLTASRNNIDKKYVHYAAFELFGRLLQENIQIYEYQPSMTHTKLLLIDDQWVNIGSANFDPRSFFHNEELDLSTDNLTLISAVEALFESAFDHSRQVSLMEWKNRSLWRNKLMGRLISFMQWQL